jgi:hypothetical protein
MMPTLHTIQSILLGWMHHYHDAALWIERNGPASDK